MAPEPPSQSGAGRGSEAPASLGFQNIVGESPALRSAVLLALRVADHPGTTVLLQGETGTGKELFARGIHYASANAGEPFVTVNCAAIPENLLESELFGHEKGAFTDARTTKKGLLELAGNGTIFLDEIGDLPPSLQPKVLRVLEDKHVRRLGGLEERAIQCRVIAAANADLTRRIAEGRFREDLYYRLNVFRIELPALRERPSDIEILARTFVDAYCREHGLEERRLTPAALALLMQHDWPGNIRELKNTLERAVILAEGRYILPQHIAIQARALDGGEVDSAGPSLVRASAAPAGPEDLTLEGAERRAVRAALERSNGNRARAARILGISRPTMLRKIRKYGLGQ